MDRNPRELQVFPRPKLSAVAGGVDGLERVPARTLACVHEAGAPQAVGHLQGRRPGALGFALKQDGGDRTNGSGLGSQRPHRARNEPRRYEPVSAGESAGRSPGPPDRRRTISVPQ